MSDYVLTMTIEFDRLADAERMMRRMQAFRATQSLEIRGMGYPLAWFKRDGCQVCHGHGAVTDYDRDGNVQGRYDCAECNGTGIVADPHWDYRNEPVEAGEANCPVCRPQTVRHLSEDELASIAAVADQVSW